jgi:hypothetical protein
MIAKAKSEGEQETDGQDADATLKTASGDATGG